MNTKSVISTLLIASTLSVALPAKKAQAGLLITAGSLTYTFASRAGNMGPFYTLFFGAPAGLVVSVAGVITAFANPALGVGLIILSEDGSLPQNDLEAILSQKYSFIQDNKVIADLASLVKMKADSIKAVDGKKMVSLSEAEIKSVLESTDLLETHHEEIKKMISELK